MKVYFNNSCKICRSEINLYKKENIEEIDWVDITNNSAAEKETSKKDKDLLRRLHVKEGNKIIEGAEASAPSIILFPSFTCNLLKRSLSFLDVSFSAAELLVISTQSISSIFSFLYKLISDLHILQELLKYTFITFKYLSISVTFVHA